MSDLNLNISVNYDPFNLTIERQLPMTGITGFFGHSGSVKSTLLRVIAGLIQNAQGTIICKDKTLFNSKTNCFKKQEKEFLGLLRLKLSVKLLIK